MTYQKCEIESCNNMTTDKLTILDRETMQEIKVCVSCWNHNGTNPKEEISPESVPVASSPCKLSGNLIYCECGNVLKSD